MHGLGFHSTLGALSPCTTLRKDTKLSNGYQSHTYRSPPTTISEFLFQVTSSRVRHLLSGLEIQINFGKLLKRDEVERKVSSGRGAQLLRLYLRHKLPSKLIDQLVRISPHNISSGQGRSSCSLNVAVLPAAVGLDTEFPIGETCAWGLGSESKRSRGFQSSGQGSP